MTDMTALNPDTPDGSRSTIDDPDGPLRIAVLVGSTRPGRKSRMVADWVATVARDLPSVRAAEAVVEVVDIEEACLPLLDEPIPPVFGAYQHDHSRAWSQTVARFDAFVIVTPEYNHSVPAALKNAIDYLYAEWNFAPVGFVGFGLTGGVRAVEHLRQIMTEVKALPTGSQVALSVFEDFAFSDMTDPMSPATMAARDHQRNDLAGVIQDVLSLGDALRALRRETRAGASGLVAPGTP